ncbi:aminopeptidase P family protein, partial [Candidatus Thorarchaeota archaeon]
RETSQIADPVLPLILDGDLVWQSGLLFARSGEKVAIVGSFDADAIGNTGIFDRVIPYVESVEDFLLEELERLNPEQIAVNYSRDNVAADGLTVGMYQILKDHLSEIAMEDRLVSAEGVIGKLRGRKTPTEISRIRRAVEITEAIYDEMKEKISVGMTELHIYHMFHRAMELQDVTSAWNPDHNPAVDAGPNKEFGHSGPTDNKTKEGHLLHFDFGVRWKDYCSDIQRMFFFGGPSDIPEEVKTAFDTVCGAIQSAADFIRPGRVGHEVDAVAREYVVDRGYEGYKHALGHQVGRQAHDGGTLLGPLWERYGDSPRGEVEKGNVFTLELYVTTDNFGQVSLEEDIVVTSNGCEFLSSPQTELICIE